MQEFFLNIISSMIAGVLTYFAIEGIKKITPKIKDFINKMMS